MKHRKTFLTLALVLVMGLSLLPTRAKAEDILGENYEHLPSSQYTLQNGVLTIHEGVTRIGKGAFSDDDYREIVWNDKITSVIIPGSVKEIGQQAFMGCATLTSVTMAEGVTEIGPQAFAYCWNLTSVTLPKSVTQISGNAFGDTPWLNGKVQGDFAIVNGILLEYRGSEENVVIPQGVTKIAEDAFKWKRMVKSVSIPDGVTEIGAEAFYDCYEVTRLTIPGSVTDIGENAFYTNAEGLIITGQAGSAAETYAKQNGVTFMAQGSGAANIAYAATQTVWVDGVPVEFQCYALKDARGYPTNYVKLRDVAYVLNGTAAQFNVRWSPSAIFLIPDTEYIPNGSEMSTPFSGDRPYAASTDTTVVGAFARDLDAFVLLDDRGGAYTYYKLRDLGAHLGFHVDWSAEKGILIETE